MIRKWIMNVFPHQVKDYLYKMRKRYSHVSFTISNPQTFDGSAAIEVMEACKMVGIYGSILDLQKFVDEDQPDWIERNSKKYWVIPETLFTV